MAGHRYDKKKTGATDLSRWAEICDREMRPNLRADPGCSTKLHPTSIPPNIKNAVNELVPEVSGATEWNWPEAVAWVNVPSIHGVALVRQQGRYWSRVNPSISLGAQLTIGEGFRSKGSGSVELIAALRDGRVRSVASAAPGGSRRPVAAAEWSGARVEIREGAICVSGVAGGPIWFWGPAIDVKSLWEAFPIPSRSKPAVMTKSESEAWYRKRVTEAERRGETYSREADEAAGKQIGLSRERVRDLRSALAPQRWQAKGRRS